MAESRRDYSQRRLDDLTRRMREINPLLSDHRLCVYATGSYGRLEAWQ